MPYMSEMLEQIGDRLWGDVPGCVEVSVWGEKRAAEGETEGTTKAPVLIGVKWFRIILWGGL